MTVAFVPTEAPTTIELVAVIDEPVRPRAVTERVWVPLGICDQFQVATLFS